jgi:hypothetical protein
MGRRPYLNVRRKFLSPSRDFHPAIESSQQRCKLTRFPTGPFKPNVSQCKMVQSIGANLYGFVIGGSIFYFQLFLIGAFDYFTGRIQMDVPTIIVWCVMGGIWIFYNMAVLYWVSCILIVFPASFLFRAVTISASVAVGVGGVIGGAICWMLLKKYGYANFMQWPHCLTCLSSSVVTGSVTGLMLHLTSRDTATSASRSVSMISRNYNPNRYP